MNQNVTCCSGGAIVASVPGRIYFTPVWCDGRLTWQEAAYEPSAAPALGFCTDCGAGYDDVRLTALVGQ